MGMIFKNFVHSTPYSLQSSYQRLEIIGGFTDGVFHTIAAGFIIIEALEHILVEIEEPSYSSYLSFLLDPGVLTRVSDSR